MRTITCFALTCLMFTSAMGANPPLIPPPLNAILGEISPGMTMADVKKVLSPTYPAVTVRLGFWGGQTGYFDCVLNEGWWLSVAACSDLKKGKIVDERLRFIISDRTTFRCVEIETRSPPIAHEPKG